MNLELNCPQDEPQLTHLSQTSLRSSGEKAGEDSGQVLFWLCKNPQEPGTEQADDTKLLGCSKSCFRKIAASY